MASRSPVFRVETYEITSSDFTGTTYRLHLRHELSTHYFAMVCWGVAANVAYNASDLLARVTADPYGTGDLSLADGNYLELTRSTAVNPCAMKVVVVECLRDEDGAGFRLLDVQATSLAASAGAGTQTTTDTCGTAWPDASRVVLFGGYRGGGMSGSASGSQLQTGGTRVYPSSTATINIVQYASGAGNLAAATITTYCVQWGLEWLVQRATVTGTNTGATLASTGHYSSQALTYTVERARSWWWACGYTDGTTPGAGFLGQVAALGDGVAQNSSESAVVVGGMAAITVRSVDVYVLTHQQLVAEQDFRPTSGGSGAASVTVAAPQVAETYRTADGLLYTVSTRGERLALAMAGVTSTTAGDLSEVQVHARPTASTTVTATPADTSPGLNWAGWVQTVDLGAIDTPAGKLPVFRVTTYRVGSGQFTGTTYTLALLYTLSSNYFVQIQGTTAGASTQDVDDVNARVTSDPAGTGDLEATGSNGLILTRAAAGADWVGTVTVVECLRSPDQHGFRLLSVVDVGLASTSADRQITETTLSGVTYGDLDRVQVLAGYRGGGLTTDGSGSTSGHSAAGAVYGRPYGTNGVRLHRRSSATMLAGTACAYVVEWGSAWTVRRQAVDAVAGGTDINATSEYSAPSLSGSVTAARAALFASAVTEGANANMNYTGIAVTLGDGVTVGTTPSTVAVAAWSGSANPYEVLVEVLEHADLAVDQVKLASDTGTTGSITVDAPLASEHYGTYNSLAYTCGRRLPMAHTACSLASDAIAAAVVQARLTGRTTQTWLRDRADASSVAGWFQSIDLGGIYADSEAVQVNGDADDLDVPVGYLVFQDPHYAGAENVTSATSEAGATLGLVEAATTNRGAAYPYQEGEPSSAVELTLRAQGGGSNYNVGDDFRYNGGWIYRLSTESTTADWKGMNDLQILQRYNPATTSATLYGHALAYSTANDRVLVAWVQDSTTIQLRYAAGDDTLQSWTSATITVEDADATGVAQGLAMAEAADGSMRMALQISRNGLLDMDLYTSTDGLTWTVATKNIAARAYGSAGYGGAGEAVYAVSGDYERVFILDDISSTTTSAFVYQFGSSDRGASWKICTAATAYSHETSSNVWQGSLPYDVVGVGDIGGTFLMATLKGTGSDRDSVSILMATGLEDFSVNSSLELDFSTYGTSVLIKGLWFARVPDGIHLYVWYVGSDVNDIALVKISLADVSDPNNWTVAVPLGFSGAINYGPFRPRGVWAGCRGLVSGGILDPSVAGGADPLVAGHWCMEFGAWDPKPLARSSHDVAVSLWYALVRNMLSYAWRACLGSATAAATTPYTAVTTAATITWANTGTTYNTTSVISGVAYHQLSVTPASDPYTWGAGSGNNHGYTFCARMSISAQRSTSAEDGGMRVMAPTTSGVLTTGYDVTVRTYTTQVVLYDNITGSALATISTTDFASTVEVRLTIYGNKVWLAWRLASSAPIGAWTEYGSYTMTSGSITGQIFRIGILAVAGAISGTTTVVVQEWSISQLTALGQRTDITKPGSMFGAPMTREPLLTANGVWVGWGGAGSFDGDTYTAALSYQRGTAMLSLDSPSYYWESTSLVSNAVALQADPDSGTGARWQMDALLLVGTTDRTCTVEFSDTDSWTSPAESIELDATLWDDLTVVSVDGAAVQLEAATGEVFAPWRGELLGTYLRFTVAGSASGKTYAVKADQFSEDGWVAVADGVDLASAGVTVGAKACIYADRMVLLAASRYRYRYFRLVFPDVSTVGSTLGTATGTHRIGALVPGHYLELNRQQGPLKVSYTDTEEALTTTARSRSGVEQLVQDGESARTIVMDVQAADEDAPTGTRGAAARAIRDILRVAHVGYTRPVGLVMDSTWRSRANVVYGILNRDGTALDQTIPYKGNDGSGRFHAVANVKLRLDEVG